MLSAFHQRSQRLRYKKLRGLLTRWLQYEGSSLFNKLLQILSDVSSLLHWERESALSVHLPAKWQALWKPGQSLKIICQTTCWQGNNAIYWEAKLEKMMLLSHYLPDLSGEIMTRSCCQNSLGGWCSKEIPQFFFEEMESGKKWNLVKLWKRSKTLEANHTRNQTPKPLPPALTTLGEAFWTLLRKPYQLWNYSHTHPCTNNRADRREHSPHMPGWWGQAAWLSLSLYLGERGCQRITVRAWEKHTVSFTIIIMYYHILIPLGARRTQAHNYAETDRFLLERWTLLPLCHWWSTSWPALLNI